MATVSSSMMTTFRPSTGSPAAYREGKGEEDRAHVPVLFGLQHESVESIRQSTRSHDAGGALVDRGRRPRGQALFSFERPIGRSEPARSRAHVRPDRLPGQYGSGARFD